MTTQRIVLPYLRGPNHIPRRDLVLGGADSMALEVAIVEYDNPAAPALDLTGGIGGPTLTLFIWPAGCWPRSWDYGAPCMTPGSPAVVGGRRYQHLRPGHVRHRLPARLHGPLSAPLRVVDPTRLGSRRTGVAAGLGQPARHAEWAAAGGAADGSHHERRINGYRQPLTWLVG